MHCRTDVQADGQTDGLRTLDRNFLNGGYNIIPCTFKVAGYKKWDLYLVTVFNHVNLVLNPFNVYSYGSFFLIA